VERQCSSSRNPSIPMNLVPLLLLVRPGRVALSMQSGSSEPEQPRIGPRDAEIRGVVVSALLPQPRGFEGFPLVQEQTDAGELAVLDAHRLEDRPVEEKPAPWCIEVHTESDEDLVPGGH
jgi:hypothetical protein